MLLYIKELPEVMLLNFLLYAFDSGLFFQHTEFVEFKRHLNIFPILVTVVLVIRYAFILKRRKKKKYFVSKQAKPKTVENWL